ncbi:polymorphic toxin type 17 domain-containing protein [Actinophytocola sediminis]
MAHNITVDDLHTYYVTISHNISVLVHNDETCSIKSRMCTAGPGDLGLPNQGKVRYVPPKGYNASNPLPRGPGGGYLDRFGNEWVVGPSRTKGESFEWEVQLSRTGQSQLGWLSRDGRHVNVSLMGRVTH